jgi:drug/metabolite transporter (DMT)-like permease
MERRVRAAALVLTAAAIWGSSFVVIKLGLGDPGGAVAAAPPVTSSLLRFAIAAIASTAILRAEGPLRPGALRDPLVVAIALSNAVGYALQYMGLVQTNPAVASLLANIAVVVTVLLSAAVLHERISARTALAVTLAFAGGSVLATRGDLNSVGTPEFAAAAMIAVASLFWSVYVVLNKMALERGKYSESELTWAIFVLTALATVPIAFALEGPPTFQYSPVAWASILYNGILCSSVAFVIYMVGLRELTAISTAVLTVAEILVAFMLTFIVFGVGMNGITAVGAALVVGGILLTSLRADAKKGRDPSLAAPAPPGEP